MEVDLMDIDFASAMNTLEDKLRSLPVGSTISYDKMNEIAGFDVREHRHVLESLKRKFMKIYGLDLVNIRGRGYRISHFNNKNVTKIIDCNGMSDKFKLQVIEENLEGAVSVEITKDSGVFRIIL